MDVIPRLRAAAQEVFAGKPVQFAHLYRGRVDLTLLAVMAREDS